MAAFDASNRQVYLITNKGALDLSELDLMDPTTGVTTKVESDPESRVDLRNVATSEVDYRILFTEYEDDVPRRYFRDKAFEQAYRWLKAQLPGKDITFGSHSRDESIWVLTAYSDTDPGATYIWNRKAHTLALQYLIREELPRESLSERRPYQFSSSDGLLIHGYLTLPKGLSASGLPLIVWPHGGPWARDTYGYDTFAQFLSNRGYAVLQPNFRGSTGYGKRFLNAGNGEWGRKMQDDLTWGVKALVDAGTVDRRRAGIGGGSYGGYATLAGVAFTPDLYAAAVAIVAPSNLITLLDAIPPYWEAGRKQMYTRMADPTTAQGKALLVAESPLTQAKAIVTPLLVVQGRNDPRVNVRESDQIVAAVRDNGKPVEYLVAPDEGHGFARPINNLVLYTSAEKFLAKHLGGRYQESMTPAITERMAVLTVDPKSVVLVKKVDVPTGAPKPTAELTPGTVTWKARLEAAGQTMPMDLTRTVKDSSGVWVVSETAAMPMGVMSDEAVIDKGSLLLRKRVIHQGPAVIEVSFADNKATGTMSMNGQNRPITADLGGALFADGPGASDVIAALPLAEGYTTTFRNFDIMGQKVQARQLKVVGSEKVTVPAGSFDAWKVEITPADGGTGETTTLWVDKATRRPVKSVTVLPQMNGAVATAELVK